MARAIRASASSVLIVHSENGFDSRKLDEGRMAHPPLGCPLPCEPNYGRLKIVPSKTRRHRLAEPPTKPPRCRSPAGLSTCSRSLKASLDGKGIVLLIEL